MHAPSILLNLPVFCLIFIPLKSDSALLLENGTKNFFRNNKWLSQYFSNLFNKFISSFLYALVDKSLFLSILPLDNISKYLLLKFSYSLSKSSFLFWL